MLVRLAALAGTVLFCSFAAGQQQHIVTDDGSIIVIDGEFEMEMSEEMASADGAATSSTPPTPRAQKLKKLEFDRRPSAILAAWLKPVPRPEPLPPLPPEEAPVEGEAAPEGAGDPPADAADAPPETGGETAGAGATDAAAGEAPPPVTVEESADVIVEGAAPPADASAEPAEALSGAAADAKETKKSKAEAKKTKAEADKARKEAEAKALDAEIEFFRYSVTIGDWEEVRSYLAGLTEDERRAGYDRLLESLEQGPSKRPQNIPQQGQQYIEKNRFALSDVQGLAAATTPEPTKENSTRLGKLLRQSLDSGHQIEPFLAELRPRLDEASFLPTRRHLARMLVAAGEERALEGLLPSEEQAQSENDREGFNLLARYYLARHAEDSKVDWLEKAWHVTQAALAAGEIDEESKNEAIQRAVDIAPKIQAELGARWLNESFTERPERGMEIVAAIGTTAAQALSMKPLDSELRLRLLELQTTAAEALLAAAPERAVEWESELGLLAGNWMREAELTYQLDDSSSLGPRMQRDVYGNFFYYDAGSGMRGNMPAPIRTQKLLEHRPSDAWLAHVEATVSPRFHALFAQLFLKVSEEAQAFPYIEALAKVHPESAEDLVDEFLRVWAKNHDPNAAQNRTNSYMFMYGFEERASGIPLTRSKQDRNLRELGEWVTRLRGLAVEVDEEQLAAAFQAAHSRAEVYRLETIESIFGSLDELEPATLAALVQTMRRNLVSVWRDPAVQEKNKTNRHQKDIETEVLRGYQLARDTIDRALAAHAESWELVLARAALEHDENRFRHELAKDPEFSARRMAAFETFHRAAELYGAAAGSLERDDESTLLHETWFYAALGACDLQAVSHETALAAAEIPLIRAALEGLPSACAERHRDSFANSLYTRMSSVAPAVKFRYVREGLAITGDHPLVSEAKAVFDYYSDLVTEIQLVARIDGSDRVGHGAPFGLFVDLRHTKEIERESGGFAKYLQNQNSQSFGWNYGRPLEDYRDKFEEATREALAEHFDVLSVTFEEPDVRSRAVEPYGWRVTPYAYILLQARGAEVDRVPPLRLDLDFLDTTGYAVLPVESAALPIDAQEPAGEERPFAELALTQMLDEREASTGKLVLEVKASAHGLPPELPALIDLDPGEFDLAATEDHGVSVVQFDEEGDGVLAERTWTLTLRAREGLAAPPSTFAFGTPRVETKSDEHSRYEAADLASVGATVELEQQYGKPDRTWLWWIPAGLALAAAFVLLTRLLRRHTVAPLARFRVPDPLTPFSVLGLLRDIHTHDGLSPESSTELRTQIESLERHYFVEAGRDTPDLRRIAEAWVGRAR